MDEPCGAHSGICERTEALRRDLDKLTVTQEKDVRAMTESVNKLLLRIEQSERDYAKSARQLLLTTRAVAEQRGHWQRIWMAWGPPGLALAATLLVCILNHLWK
jgi:hypothetical protein